MLSGAAAPLGHPPTPGEHASDVYCYAVCNGGIDSLERAAPSLGLSLSEVFSAVTQLMELRLLRTDGAESSRLLPVEPERATSELISPIERGIYARRELVDRLKENIEAVTRGQEGVGEPAGVIARLEGAGEIRGLLKLASDACRTEVTILRSSQDDTVDDLLEACYGVLERDVPTRILCPHRSRASFATRAKSKRLIDNGAVIRTISQVPQAAVVFDRSLAVVLDLGDDGSVAAARQVRDAGVVRFLVEMFDQLWEGASPFMATETGYAEVVDDLQQSIARLLARGYTDEVVARKLGMSVRTCRRHISALLRNLDSVSRFQAGVQAAQRYAFEGAQSA